MQLINTGQFDQARALARAQSPRPSEAAFYEGRILKVEGRYGLAIDTFRRALVLDPANLAARRELAHTLLLDKQYDVAQFHFEALLASDPNTAMHEGYRQFLKAIRQNKPFGTSASFALLPSSNINRGTTNTVFDTDSGTFIIDENSQAASGVGVQLGVSAFARLSPTPKSAFVVNGSIVATGYEEDIYNSATATIGLTYGKLFDGGRWSAGPYTSYGWREDEADVRTMGVRMGVDYRIAPKTSLGFRANHEYRTYPNQSYNDGRFDKVSFSVGYHFDPTLVVRGTVNAEQSDPNALHLQYDGYSLAASVSKAWEGGLVTKVSLEAGQRAYVGVFPLTTMRRSDEFATLSVSIQNQRVNLNGFVPKLSCSVKANRSNIAFYDYNTQECQATLSKEF